MVKGLYQIPPRTRLELLHFNLWWSEGLELINKDFDQDRGCQLFRQGVWRVEDIWDGAQQNFLTWEQTQSKFHLSSMEEGEWLEVIDNVSGQWRQLLETEEDPAYPGQWVDFYKDEKSDPAFILRCATVYTPILLQRYNIFHPLPVQCFTIGKHSRCLRTWENPSGRMNGSYHKVKIIRTNRGPTKDGVKEEVVFFYGKVATLGWDPDRWRWADGGHFLDYTTKAGRDSITNRTPDITRAGDKWQGYLPGNYRFFWSQVWDPLRSGKEAAFIWSIWHKAVAVNEWRARIAPASISKQCIFCLPNTSESVKHKFWDCIQARRTWRWATYIMHELCGVRTGHLDSFNWKQTLFGERTPYKFRKVVKIWHLLRGTTLWTIWVEWNDKVFNQEQWHESKMKYSRIWDTLLMYAHTAWQRVLKLIKISRFSAAGLLQNFDRTWGAKQVLCRRKRLVIDWNWKRYIS
jgi:hypothetical protein